MAQQNESVKGVRHRDDAVVVDLAGEVDLLHNAEIHQALVDVCADKPLRLLVNLTEVTYMDSSGVGLLVEAYRKIKEYDGRLILFGLSPRVRSVFEVTKLDNFFRIVETEAEALA
jgi:anti-sigma B factor antagonist